MPKDNPAAYLTGRRKRGLPDKVKNAQAAKNQGGGGKILSAARNLGVFQALRGGTAPTGGSLSRMKRRRMG